MFLKSIVSGFFISFQTSLLLVYKKVSHFAVLILYPATLLKCLCNNIWVEVIGILKYRLISVDGGNFISPFPL